MKSGYKILWTDNALHELAQTIEYIQEKGSCNIPLKNISIKKASVVSEA